MSSPITEAESNRSECGICTPEAFSIAIPESVLTDIYNRVKAYPWDVLADAGGWRAGTDIGYLRKLSRYWLEGYDWRVAEANLNKLPQFRATVEGLPLHFVHLKGSGPNPVPLLLCHGWPGSFFEFAEAADQLAHPERYGGNAEDAFDVVIPSLPGYAFSGRPSSPMGPRAIARLFNTLMTDVLGYSQYLAQGGDWGAHVAGWLGYDHARSCRAIHLNLIGLRNPDMAPQTDEELAWHHKLQTVLKTEGPYLLLQETKPQSLAFAMMDSPVGTAAWIIEKFAAWSDLPRDVHGTPLLNMRYSDDQLLTHIMIYLVSRCFATATWIYFGFLLEHPPHLKADTGLPPQMDPGTRVEVPTAVAAFPDPVFAPPPRSLVERGYAVAQWTDMPCGGHFAAMEEPELFADDLRKFARLIWRSPA